MAGTIFVFISHQENTVCITEHAFLRKLIGSKPLKVGSIYNEAENAMTVTNIIVKAFDGYLLAPEHRDAITGTAEDFSMQVEVIYKLDKPNSACTFFTHP